MAEKKVNAMKKISFTILLALLVAGIVRSQPAPLPQLKITADGRYFQTSDGKPFFWLGDTGWLLFVKLTREQTIQYLDTRKAQGYNVIQVMVLHDLKNAVNKYGDSALVQRDASAPMVTQGSDTTNTDAYDFWDHVDFVIDAA